MGRGGSKGEEETYSRVEADVGRVYKRMAKRGGGWEVSGRGRGEKVEAEKKVFQGILRSEKGWEANELGVMVGGTVREIEIYTYGKRGRQMGSVAAQERGGRENG